MHNLIVALVCRLVLLALVLRFGPPSQAQACKPRPVRTLARVYGIGADWPRLRFVVRIEVAALVL